MSLTSLSEKSTLLMIQVLANQGGYKTIHNLRKCCLGLNQLIVRKEFPLVGNAELLTVEEGGMSNPNSLSYFLVMLNQNKWDTPELLNKEYRQVFHPNYKLINYRAEGICSRKLKWGASPFSWESAMTVFRELFSKVKNVGHIQILHMKEINSEFVERFQEFANKTRKTKILQIRCCKDFNLTFLDFTRLLAMFPNLKALCIDGLFNGNFVSKETDIDPSIQRIFNFGIIVQTPEVEKKLLYLQRKANGFVWNTTIITNRLEIVQVRYPLSSILASFTLQKPAKKYDYKIISNILPLLREKIAHQDEITEEFEKEILSAITDIDDQICEYLNQRAGVYPIEGMSLERVYKKRTNYENLIVHLMNNHHRMKRLQREWTNEHILYEEMNILSRLTIKYRAFNFSSREGFPEEYAQ